MTTPTNLAIYLLAIRGTLAAPTVEASRAIHNKTAGDPNNVAAAQSLGDLSHMVYVPTDPDEHIKGAGEFLILDQWNNMEGLNQFFANPHVQEQAGQIFAGRDPVVWGVAEGFASYHFPAPYGKNDRIVATVRGPVKSVAEALTAHNAMVSKQMNKARRAGNLSHESYFRLAAPGSPEALEYFGVDIWTNAKAMDAYYEADDFMASFSQMFAGEPAAKSWVHPAGEWVEW